MLYFNREVSSSRFSAAACPFLLRDVRFGSNDQRESHSASERRWARKGARGSRNAVNLFASPPAPSLFGARGQTRVSLLARYRGTIVELVGTRRRKRRIRLLPACFVPLDACLIESGAGSIVTRDLVPRLHLAEVVSRISSGLAIPA